MTTFLDGPAKGQTLMISRSPIFLRMACADGSWDALDQVNDRPRPNEEIFAYIMVSHGGSVHVHRGHGKSGWYQVASYRLIERQPAAAVLRSNESWVKWCRDCETKWCRDCETKWCRDCETAISRYRAETRS